MRPDLSARSFVWSLCRVCAVPLTCKSSITCGTPSSIRTICRLNSDGKIVCIGSLSGRAVTGRRRPVFLRRALLPRFPRRVKPAPSPDQCYRNSFHWDPWQYDHLSTTDPNSLTNTDYAIGRLDHWLATDPSTLYTSSTLSLRGAPSPDGVTGGQLTWYDYAGKPP